MLNWLSPDTVHLLIRGLWITVLLTAITSITSMILGIATGICRLSSRRVWRVVGTVHVELHRNVPALVLIIFWAFAIPNLFPPDWRQEIFFTSPFFSWLTDITGLPLSYYALAVIVALTLNTSAYIAELFRAGVGTIAQEHVDAARVLGASTYAVFWTILLPQGVRAAFPAMATRLIHNMKNTSLAALVAVPELFLSTQVAISQTFQATQFLLLTAVLYLLLAAGYSALLRWAEHRLAPRPRRISAIPGIAIPHG